MTGLLILSWILFLFFGGIFCLFMDHISTPPEITHLNLPQKTEQSDLAWHTDYVNDDGSSYTLMYSLNENWFEYLYYDFFFDANVYRWYSINSTSTVLTDEGNFLSPC